MNKLILIGNLTRDPVLREYGQSAVCTFDIAVTMRGKDKKPPLYVTVSVWDDKLRANCAKYLKKGSKVCVDGELDYPYAYKSEQGEARANVKMKAASVEFLPNPNAKPQGGQDTLPQSIPGVPQNNYGYQSQRPQQGQPLPWESGGQGNPTAGFSEVDPNDPAPWLGAPY